MCMLFHTNSFNASRLSSTASPSSTVFFLGGSVEFSNLSFSPELTDPSSTQFHLQSQALGPYVSIHTYCIYQLLCGTRHGLVGMQRTSREHSTLIRVLGSFKREVGQSCASCGVLRSSPWPFLDVKQAASGAPPSFRPLCGPLKCKASCNQSSSWCEAARWERVPEGRSLFRSEDKNGVCENRRTQASRVRRRAGPQ